MTRIVFAGLGDPVLANYLAVLGVFRAVSRQADPAATLYFGSDGVPVLETAAFADDDAWLAWVLDDWRPSPIASPWNSGAGFYGSSKSVGCTDGVKRNGVELVLSSHGPRLNTYRETLEWMQAYLNSTGYGTDTAPAKEELLAGIRNLGPEAALPWLDAVCVVEPLQKAGRDTREAKYLSLLGSGGNDGRLDFGNNFMIHVCRLLDLPGCLIDRGKHDRAWAQRLLGGLLGAPVAGMIRDTAGQLAPVSRGAPNGVSGTASFSAPEQVNPWLFVWGLEGALLFAGAATRRLGSHGRVRGAFPFHADRVDAGFGSAAAEKGRDELWLPLWRQPASYREIEYLFGEARAQVGRRRARSGLDYARAVGGLGATRGLHAFQRYAIVERAGQSSIAVHAGNYAAGEAAPLDRLRALDGYLERFRRLGEGEHIPPRFGRAWRRFARATLALARQSSGTRQLELLAALGTMRREEACGLPDDASLPIFSIDDAGWLSECDSTPELRLAVAVCSLSSRDPFGRFASYLWPGHHARATSREAPRAELVPLLELVLDRRLLEHRDPDGVIHRVCGGGSTASAHDIAQFVGGRVDDNLLLDLVWALSTAPNDVLTAGSQGWSSGAREIPAELPRLWMLARLAVDGALPDPMPGRWHAVRPPREVPAAMRANRASVVAQRANHALRAAGWPAPLLPAGGLPRDARTRRRMAAALLFPLPPSVSTKMAAIALAWRLQPTTAEVADQP